MATRTSSLAGLCFVCIENDVIGERATVADLRAQLTAASTRYNAAVADADAVRERLAARVAELEQEIGSAPSGSHPDEQKPRAATWHAERLNWIAETEMLRGLVENYEVADKIRKASRLHDDWKAEVRTVMSQVARERDAALARVAELEAAARTTAKGE